DTSLVGTLRGAVEWANANTNLVLQDPLPNLILFDTTGRFATPQTITLSMGPLVLSNANVVEMITGPGVTGPNALTVSGNNAVEVFFNSTNVTSTISGMTVTKGNTGTNSSSNFNGGGVLNWGTLILSNMNLTNNFGELGGAFSNSGNLTISNSTFSGNTAVIGAVATNTGSLVINNSTLSGNMAGDSSAIWQYNPTPGEGLTITN